MAHAKTARGASATRRDQTPLEMLRSPAFWVMFLMFTLTAIGGLIFTAQLTPIAKDFTIGNTPVSLFGLTLTALTFALSVSRITNGVSRPFFGWVSDRVGRENTMMLAFSLEGVAILLLAQLGRQPVAFVLLTALVFFAYGEIYSLFPAICGDAYGRKFASANAGLLYVGKGVASLFVPLSSLIAASAFGWRGVFVGAAILNFIAAVMATLLLKPLRAREHRAGGIPGA